MSDIEVALPGAELLTEVEERFNVRPETLEEQMARYGTDILIMDEAETQDAYKNLAAQILMQELALQDVQGEEYRRPAFIGLTNGAIPVLSEVGKILTSYGFDIDPFMIETDGGYDEGTEAGEARIVNGLSDSDKDAISGRRVIVMDDMWDTGGTLRFVEKYLVETMVGEVTLEAKGDEPERTVQLEPMHETDIQFVILLTKDKQETDSHTPPTLSAKEVSKEVYTYGGGGNGLIPDGKGGKTSIARFAGAVTAHKR